MSEEQGTLTEDTGDSSEQVAAQSGDLVSTVEFAMPTGETPSEETQKTEKTDGGDKGEKTEEKTKVDEVAEQKATEKADNDRFDKHPRFQKLITGNRTLKEQIAQQAQQIKALQKPTKEKAPKYIDMGEKSNAELTEMFEESPQTFVRNIAKQLNAEIRGEVLSEVQETIAADKEQVEQKAIERTYTKYAQDHSDFNQLWDNGQIQDYMDENPGHNAISAHMALTKEVETKAAIDEAVAQAVKDTEVKTAKNLKAKKKAKVLGSGPSYTGHAVGQTPDELKDTKKYGGLVASLTARSIARENAAAP